MARRAGEVNLPLLGSLACPAANAPSAPLGRREGAGVRAGLAVRSARSSDHGASSNQTEQTKPSQSRKLPPKPVTNPIIGS
jgi:hypothetical protein